MSTKISDWDVNSVEFRRHVENMQHSGAPGGYYIVIVKSVSGDQRKVSTYSEGPFLYRHEAKGERDTMAPLPHDPPLPPPRGHIVGIQYERGDRRRIGTPRLFTPVEHLALRMARRSIRRWRQTYYGGEKGLAGLTNVAVVACMVGIARRYEKYEDPELLPWLMERTQKPLTGPRYGPRYRLRDWLEYQSGDTEDDFQELGRTISYEADRVLDTELVFDLVQALATTGAL